MKGVSSGWYKRVNAILWFLWKGDYLIEDWSGISFSYFGTFVNLTPWTAMSLEAGKNRP